MRRPVLLALLAAALALPAAGCGGDSTAAEPELPPPPTAPQPPAPPPPPAPPSPTFVKADLSRIALGSKNAPPGLRFVKEESGPMSLADAGLMLPAHRRPLTALGYLAMHDSIFVAKRPGSDQRISQRIWLFKNRGGATGWLQKTEDDAVQLQFAEVEAPVLGDESWAAGGLIQVGGGQAITHAFQLGNTVQTVSMYGEATPPNEAGALAAAQAALAKARKG